MRRSWRRLCSAGLIAALTLVACGNDDESDYDSTTQSTDSPDTTAGATTLPSTTTSADTTVTADQPVLWPRPSSDVRFDEPEEAARSFALYYAQLSDPVVGEFQPTEDRLGKVEITSGERGPTTNVFVYRMDDENWYVVFSTAHNIVVDKPAVGDPLTCPLVTSGVAVAFEAQVDVRIDAYLPDGRRVEAGRGFVMGSGTPPPGPFAGEIACTPPEGVEPWGIASYFTLDAASDSGGVQEIVAVPVRLAG